jgi:hypothetical protein
VSYDIDTGTCCFTDVNSELRHRQEYAVLLMSIVSYDIDTGTCCFTDVNSELRHRHRNMLFY